MKRMLIVDDSISARQMLRFTLEKAGYEVAEAEDGVDAIKTISNGDFDGIITDVNMPKLDGYGLVKKIRMEGPNRFIPIIMVTSEQDEAERAKGQVAGATGWVVKPYKPSELIRTVEKIVGD